MISTIIISALLLLTGVLLMGMRIFFSKNGNFPNIHIGGNNGLKNKGISCATTQDREAQKESINKIKINELIEKITE